MGNTYLSKDGKYFAINGKVLRYPVPPDPPIFAANSSWYKGATLKRNITEVNIVDSYTVTGNEIESWNADVNNLGDIKVYLIGTKLTIVGNGAGKILANADSSSMFASFYKLASITGLKLLDVSNVTNMKRMFYYCSKITNINLSNWDTSSVVNMSEMFSNCSALINLNISKFDTSSVTNMDTMFLSCSNLSTLDVSSFNTSKITSLYNMFGYCSSLASIDVSNFNTSNITNMGAMFNNCSSLTNLDLSKWNTSNVTKTSYMFNACSNLTKIYVSNLWSSTNMTDSSSMFAGCSSLNGATSYDSSKADSTMANYTTGYLTYKAN